MQYRVVDTTDNQHRGMIVEYDLSSLDDLVVGEMRIKPITVIDKSDGTMTISDPNYVVTLEAI